MGALPGDVIIAGSPARVVHIRRRGIGGILPIARYPAIVLSFDNHQAAGFNEGTWRAATRSVLQCPADQPGIRVDSYIGRESGCRIGEPRTRVRIAGLDRDGDYVPVHAQLRARVRNYRRQVGGYPTCIQNFDRLDIRVFHPVDKLQVQYSVRNRLRMAHHKGSDSAISSKWIDIVKRSRDTALDGNIEDALTGADKGPAPEVENYSIPLGKANVEREGTDVSFISYGRPLKDMRAMVDKLAEDGISVEIIDLRTVSPLDTDTIVKSVNKTGRAVIAHEAVRSFGVGAEVAARIQEHCFGKLKAPIKRVASKDAAVPFARVLEHKAFLYQASDIEQAIRDTLEGK